MARYENEGDDLFSCEIDPWDREKTNEGSSELAVELMMDNPQDRNAMLA